MMRVLPVAVGLFLASTPCCVAAWTTSPSSSSRPSIVTSTTLFGATGGWGIGAAREMTPEEFLKNGDRKAPFDPYELSEGGDFMRKIKKDRKEMEKSQMDELLGVAKLAGIAVKDPKERLNKFEEDLEADEDDDLDVSVQWEEIPQEYKDGASITRMDEDTGSLGSW